MPRGRTDHVERRSKTDAARTPTQPEKGAPCQPTPHMTPLVGGMPVAAADSSCFLTYVVAAPVLTVAAGSAAPD